LSKVDVLAEWPTSDSLQGINLGGTDWDFGQFFRHLNVRSVNACTPTSSHWLCELQTAEVAERLCALVEWSNDAPSHMLIFGHFWYSRAQSELKFCLWICISRNKTFIDKENKNTVEFHSIRRSRIMHPLCRDEFWSRSRVTCWYSSRSLAICYAVKATGTVLSPFIYLVMWCFLCLW
jgi:hypothetical protein